MEIKKNKKTTITDGNNKVITTVDADNKVELYITRVSVRLPRISKVTGYKCEDETFQRGWYNPPGPFTHKSESYTVARYRKTQNISDKYVTIFIPFSKTLEEDDPIFYDSYKFTIAKSKFPFDEAIVKVDLGIVSLLLKNPKMGKTLLRTELNNYTKQHAQ